MMEGNFKMPSVDDLKKETEKAPVVEKVEGEGGMEKPEEILARRELETLLEEVEEMAGGQMEEAEEKQSPEKAEKKKSMKGKLVALCVAMTVFAGTFASNVEARSYRDGITGDIERGAGRAIEDVFRGAGQGSSRGVSKGLEKIILNSFGIQTDDQQRAQERAMMNQQRQMQQMERQAQQMEREYQRELSRASQHNDREVRSVLSDYQRGKLEKEKKEEILQDIQKRYNEKKDEINARFRSR